MGLAQVRANSLGVSDPTVVALPHPLAGLSEDVVRGRVNAVYDQVAATLAGLTLEDVQSPDGRTGSPVLGVGEVEAPSESDSLLAFLVNRSASDGLPVIAPTPDRVHAMLRSNNLDPHEVITTLAPRGAHLTHELLAINAVMAGCQADCLPILVAAMKALGDARFNLDAIQATTHPCAPLVIVSGPIASKVGMNFGGNAFGSGNRANATIGRAVRLALLTVGGGIPGVGDMATQGSPAKYSYAIAENVLESPWGSFAESIGFGHDASTVTVIGCEAPHNVNDHESSSGLGILKMLTGTMRVTGPNNNYYDGEVVIALSPEHAATLAQDGYSRSDVQRYLMENARTPLEFFSDENINGRLRLKWPADFADLPPIDIPIVRSEAKILIVVVGGPGKHSSFIPTFGATSAVTVAVASAAY